MALVLFMVLGSRAPWAPISSLRHLVSLSSQYHQYLLGSKMSWAPIPSNRKFEAVGAQLISGAQQILMVLGAREPRTMKSTKATHPICCVPIEQRILRIDRNQNLNINCLTICFCLYDSPPCVPAFPVGRAFQTRYS